MTATSPTTGSGRWLTRTQPCCAKSWWKIPVNSTRLDPARYAVSAAAVCSALKDAWIPSRTLSLSGLNTLVGTALEHTFLTHEGRGRVSEVSGFILGPG